LEVDLNGIWWSRGSDCFNCLDEVKRLEYVFAAVALAGVIQILIGLFKLGKFIRLVPQPVMFGFVNGLAIIIFMSQLEQFKL
jgi:SulP family sulfate permease